MNVNKALLNSYLDGELSYSESRDLEVLIKNSPELETEVESLKIGRDLIRNLIPEANMNPAEQKAWTSMINEINEALMGKPSLWQRIKSKIEFTYQ